MARGITSFDDYYKHETPGGVSYHCAICQRRIVSYVWGGQNALARASKGKAAVRAHVLKEHPNA